MVAPYQFSYISMFIVHDSVHEVKSKIMCIIFSFLYIVFISLRSSKILLHSVHFSTIFYFCHFLYCIIFFFIRNLIQYIQAEIYI